MTKKEKQVKKVCIDGVVHKFEHEHYYRRETSGNQFSGMQKFRCVKCLKVEYRTD